jgi:hypothetical protein
MKPIGSPESSTSTTEPTLRSRMSSAMWRTGRSGVAVTTDSVMTSRISMEPGRTLSIQSAPVAPPTPTQLAWRGRIEAGLRVAAPFLDLLLAVGDRLSRLGRSRRTRSPRRRRAR